MLRDFTGGRAVTRKKQIIVPIIILVTGISVFIGLSSMKKPPEEKPEVINTPIVAVEPVEVGPMHLSVDSYGVVKPKYETALVAQVSGQIVELADAFVSGGFIAKGELLARIDPSDYEAALIDAEANLASATASLETERAQGQVAAKEWKRITDASPTELSLRKPQLAQEMARVKAAKASVLRAKRNLERTEIRAPYDAMIESRDVGLGAFVSTGSRVGKLLGTDVAEVRLPVADGQLKFLNDLGQNAEVVLSGVFAGVEKQWTAKIVRSEGVVDSNSRMSYLVAEVHDPYQLVASVKDEPLRFGAYVNADIYGVTITNASELPRYLVENGRVAILDTDSKLKYIAVDIIRQDGANVIVTGDLAQGDRVIVSALDYPIAGMELALEGEKPAKGEETEETESDTQVASVME